MCMLCAAIPAALAVGANVQARQRKQAKQTEAEGEARNRLVQTIPAGPATAVVVAGLVVSAIVYHTYQG